MLFKASWAIRGLLYKVFLGGFDLPSYIGKPIYLKNPRKVFIGKRFRLFPGARIEVINKNSSIIFEDNISIGQNFHIISGSKLMLKNNTTISANVFITNIDHEYQQIGAHILQQPLSIKETQIGSNCFIGFGVVIQAGTVLGKQCIVGANAVVRGTFPDYCVIVGIPAKVIKRYDKSRDKWRKTDPKGNFINE